MGENELDQRGSRGYLKVYGPCCRRVFLLIYLAHTGELDVDIVNTCSRPQTLPKFATDPAAQPPAQIYTLLSNSSLQKIQHKRGQRDYLSDTTSWSEVQRLLAMVNETLHFWIPGLGSTPGEGCALYALLLGTKRNCLASETEYWTRGIFGLTQ